MKKVKHTDISSTSAMPFKSGTLEHLQSAHIETTKIILAAMQGALPQIAFFSSGVLYGANVTYSGSNWTMTAGAVFFNGEIFLTDAASGILTGTNVIIGTITTTNITAANYDPALFSDGTSNNVHEVRKIVWSSGASGSGSIVYNTAETWRLGKKFGFAYNSAYLTALAGTFTIASSADWDVKYTVLTGAMIMINFNIKNASNSALTPYLAIQMPFKSYEDYDGVGTYTTTGSTGAMRILIQANDNVMYLYPQPVINWPVNTGGTLAVRGQVMLSVISTT
jgi:hypothetical protein